MRHLLILLTLIFGSNLAFAEGASKANSVEAGAELNLYMAEAKGCYWCARWNKDISHIYPKTAEGIAAPLKRYNLYSDKPTVDFARKVTFTPTFILVRDGKELGRIEGYPGEDFFWPLLTQLFQKADIELKTES